MVSYRTQIVLGVIIAVLVGAGVALAFVSYLPSQAAFVYTWVGNGSTVSGGNCSQTFPGGLPISEYSQNKSIVFLMQPNSTAQICVSYRVQEAQLSSPVSDGPIVPFSVAILKENFQCNANSCSSVGTPGPFEFSASPDYITIYPGNQIARFVIVYTIHSFSNSTGLYGFTYLNACEHDIPFAVGYAPSQVNASDFVGFFTPSFGCGGPNYIGYLDYLSNGNVTGITNLSYTYIPAEFSLP
jgi:hypothetical protein